MRSGAGVLFCSFCWTACLFALSARGRVLQEKKCASQLLQATLPHHPLFVCACCSVQQWPCEQARPGCARQLKSDASPPPVLTSRAAHIVCHCRSCQRSTSAGRTTARRWWPTGGTRGARRRCGSGAWTTTRATAPTTTCTPSWPGGCVIMLFFQGIRALLPFPKGFRQQS